MTDSITGRICLLVPFAALLLTGCSSSRIGYLATAIIHPTRPQAIELSDGYNADYYTFTLGDKNAIDTYLFFVTGSGHASVQFCRHYFKNLPGNVRVFALQKRYVKHWTTGIFEAPEGFHEAHCYSNWIRDYSDFVGRILSVKNSKIERIIIFGGSEGSAVASAVTANTPQITHLVSLGEGGMRGLDCFRIWKGGKAQRIDFDQVYQTVSKNPSTGAFFGQYTYRWWKEMLDMEPMQYLQTIEIPILFAMGEKDDMVPLESLYYLENEFKRLNKQNLTVKLYPDRTYPIFFSQNPAVDFVAHFQAEVSLFSG